MNNKKQLCVRISTNVLFAVVLSSMLMFSCTKQEQESPKPDKGGLESISFSVKDTAIMVNESFQLEVICVPSEISAESVMGTWSVSDEDVLSVSDEGLVTGLKASEAVVRYTVTETILAECSVRVRDLPLPGEIGLNKDVLYMEIGDTEDVNVITNTSSDFTHSDLWWASSDESVATVSSTGEITAIGNGAVCIMASVGDLAAYCFVNVHDPSYPSEFNEGWLMTPYPYLEYPTERDRVIAAENAIGEGPLILRKLVDEDGDILTFRLRDYFDQGLASPMFETVCYDLSPETGEPIAWGHARGIRSQDMVDGIMVEMMLENRYVWKKYVDMEDGSYGGWFANEMTDRSLLIYVTPSVYENDRLMGVMEWRILSEDPLNDAAEVPESFLPERFMDFGAGKDEVKAWESENGGVLSEEGGQLLGYKVEPADENGVYYVEYMFDYYTGELYSAGLMIENPDKFFKDDGTSLTDELTDNLKAAGYVNRGDDGWLNLDIWVRLKFRYSSTDPVTGDNRPVAVIEYIQGEYGIF